MSLARSVAASAILLVWGPFLMAGDPADSPEFFEKKIRPLLVEHCYRCHADLKGKDPKGGLRVDSRAALLKGGDNGPAIHPGEPDRSRFIEAVRFQNPDLQMPPRGKLPDAAIADLVAWIKGGAVWPNAGTQAVDGPSSFDLGKRKQEHWAWRAVAVSTPPAVRDARWPNGDVDRFLLARLEANGARPAPPADLQTWIRRVTFDLIGIPPTPAEVDLFLKDSSPDAERKVVDRLLQSPHFGERWARHWLDLVRYAETRGHEFDAPIPNAFHYRDYVIRALNSDVSYERFVQEHIAGDLLPDPRRHPRAGFNESILGTGFWFLGEEVHSPVDIRQDQADRFDNRIDVLTKAFLGLTVACARCHDHKFDAISTKDYYALFGIVESTAYRQVRFDTLAQNRKIAAAIADHDRRAAAAIGGSLSRYSPSVSRRMADYLLAAREAIRTGSEFRSVGLADRVFEDFESGTYAKWEVNGTAFGDRPHSLQSIPAYQGRVNSGGKYFVNSHNVRGGGDVAAGDALTGTLTSSEFVISHRFVTMLVGGGAFDQKTCVNLLVDGKIVRTATGRNDNRMFPVRWDVENWKGKTARLQVVDDKSGGWGNIGVDDIVFTNRGEDSPLPSSPRSTDFSDGFRSRIARLAVAHKVDAVVLTAWVEAILQAANDPSKPFHLWARIALDRKLDDATRLTEWLASIRAKQKHDVLPPGTQVVVDYSRPQPGTWFPDDASFGLGPQSPGSLHVGKDGIRFVELAAATYDRAWDVNAVQPGTESDPGAIGRRVRAGRTIRTPAFQVGDGKVHYLVRGAGTAYAAVDHHTFIQGPLHGQLVLDFPDVSGFRWVTHDLTAYRGHYVHVEFTPASNGDLAIAMVVQGPSPGTNSPSIFLPGVDATTIPSIAAAYERNMAELPARWKESVPQTVDDSRLANFLLDRTDLLKAADPKAPSEIETAMTAFHANRKRITDEIPHLSRLAPAAFEGNGVDEHVFIRGSPRGLGAQVPRRFLEALSGASPIATGPGSGRLELARQMTDPKVNPLIARVLVNRVWHHLFGRGIVASVDNFGVLGELPTHPELLDFLADRFVREGWSLKQLIRDLVLSRAYRMSTNGDAASASIDPQNLLLHRMRIRRLEGEAIRDAMLAVSGRLDRTAYGAPVAIHLTPFLQGRGRPESSGPLDGAGRRSVYQAVRRNFLNPMLLAFDSPIPFSTVGRRQSSNVPAQALILLNDPFVHQQAAVWAKAVSTGTGRPQDRIQSMYRSAFGRPPTADELAACTAFLVEQRGRYGASEDDPRPWTDLAHTLFNSKEFIYVN